MALTFWRFWRRRCSSVHRITGWRCDLKTGHEGAHQAEGEVMCAAWPDRPLGG